MVDTLRTAASSYAEATRGGATQRRYRNQAERDYLPRTIGLGLGAVAVGSVLFERQADVLWWLLLAANGYVWPHVAYLLGQRSRNPSRFERGNLLADSAFVGLWIAAIHGNLLVAGLIASMVSLDNIAAGAERLFVEGLLIMAASAVTVGLLLGFPWSLEPSMLNVLCSLPMLFVYPQIIGLWTNRLTRRLNEKRQILERMSQLDGLSGLNNRQYWEYLARGEFNRYQRHGTPCSLLLLDIDFFKEFNDRYGHVAGDEVIQRLGTVLIEQLRLEDHVGRYGGEEFGVVLVNCHLDAAAAKADALVRSIREELHDLGDVTVSVGVASASTDTPDFSGWVRQADTALYDAKAQGRNRCAVSREPIAQSDQEQTQAAGVDASGSGAENTASFDDRPHGD